MTITDVIKYAIRQKAHQIAVIKAKAQKTKRREAFVYTTPDGKSTNYRRPGSTMSKVEQDVVIESISPKHPAWNSYRSLKKEVSRLLTARLLLKTNQEEVPESAFNPDVFHHAGRKRERSFAVGSLRYLRKLDNRLKNHPERFSDVEKWLQERAQQQQEVA